MESLSAINITLLDRITNERQTRQLNDIFFVDSRLVVNAAHQDPDETTDTVYRIRFVQNPHRPDQILLTFVQPAEERPDTFINTQPAVDAVAISDGAILDIGQGSYRIHLGTPTVFSTHAGWLTITGDFRENNEDALGIYEAEAVTAYLLADGVGGAYGGELVSEYTIKSMLKAVHNASDAAWGHLLRQALQQINADVRTFAESITRQFGQTTKAGSTLTMLVLHGGVGHVLHIGDSRLYRLRDGTLQQLTTDHVSDNPSQPASGSASGKRNVLQRAIGKSAEITPDIFELDVRLKDRFIICSDGASDCITQDQLAAWSQQYAHPHELAAKLVAAAQACGSRDNITLIVADIVDEAPQQEPTMPMARAYIGYEAHWPPPLALRPPQQALDETTVNDDPMTSLDREPDRQAAQIRPPVQPPQRWLRIVVGGLVVGGSVIGLVVLLRHLFAP